MSTPPATNTTTSYSPSAGVATLLSYGILLAVAESETFGEVAVALAWAIAFGVALDFLSGIKSIGAQASTIAGGNH